MTMTITERLTDHRPFYRNYRVAPGLTIRQVGDILELPVLGGSDVCREPSVYLCTIVDGAMRDEHVGGQVEIARSGDLRGWDALDGPSYRVAPIQAAWNVNCPAPVIDWLCEHAGLVIGEG